MLIQFHKRMRRIWIAGSWKTRRFLRLSGNRQDGFTLVELMVSLMILAIGIMGITRLFIFSNQHSLSGNKELVAASLIQEVREKILSETFDDIPSIFDDVDTQDSENIPVPCEAWAAHLESQLGQSGRGQIEILEPDDDTEILDRMVGVIITITWPELGEERDLVMRFVLSKVGQ